MRFSLIVATLGRVAELESFLLSLEVQSLTDFEVIIVDQNDDDRLGPVVEHFAGRMKIKWLKSSVRNSSHARNLGIGAATGEIITFPDDDCLYPDTILSQVDRAFSLDPELAGLVGPAISPSGALGSGRWHRQSGAPDMRTIWTSVIEFNMFLRTEWVDRAGGFDEELGVGAPFGSGEGVDLVIRIMNAGGKLFYDFGIRVIHPDKSLSKEAVMRAYRYGTGLGRVLRKHRRRTALPTIMNFALRPAGGMALHMLRANFMSAQYYLQTLRGRLAGFRARYKGV